MAVPAYATDLTDITTSFTLNWNLATEGGGGQNALTAPETDDFIQGTECVSRNPFSSSVRGILYDRALITVASNDAVFIWWKADVAAALDTKAGGGIRACVGATLTDYKQYYVAGSDTYALGGWRCSPVDPSNAGDLDRGTPGAAPYDTFGMMYDVPATGPSKGFPFKVDMIRHGRDIEVTAGEIANPATWDLLAAHADATARRWGIVQGTPTGAQLQGRVFWGTATTAVYSRDSNRAIVFLDTQGYVPTDFSQILFANASTDVEWDGMSITSLDSLNRGLISISNNAAVKVRDSVITGINTTTDGGSNSVWDGTTWNACNAITAAGGTFLGCTVTRSTVAANTSALIWNINDSGSGKLDGMNFVKGTTDNHAIEFGLSSPTTINLSDIDFSGYSATNDTNGAMLDFKRTTGTVTVNLSGVTINGGAGTVTYRKPAGLTVNLVASAQLTLTGLKNPTEVRVFDAGTTTEIAGQEDVTTGTFTTSIDSATYPSVDISILSLGYQNIRRLDISMSTDRSIPIAQQIDRQYLNPAAPTGVVVAGNSTGTGTNTGSVSLPSTEGNLQVIMASHRTASNAVSNPTGTGWSSARLVETEIANTNGRRAIAMWWREVPSGQSGTITYGFTSATVALTAYEFSNDAAGTWSKGGTTADADNGTTAGTSLTPTALNATGGSQTVHVAGLAARNGDLGGDPTTIANYDASQGASTGAGANELSARMAYAIDGGNIAANWAWTTSALATAISDWFIYTES